LNCQRGWTFKKQEKERRMGVGGGWFLFLVFLGGKNVKKARRGHEWRNVEQFKLLGEKGTETEKNSTYRGTREKSTVTSERNTKRS